MCGSCTWGGKKLHWARCRRGIPADKKRERPSCRGDRTSPGRATLARTLFLVWSQGRRATSPLEGDKTFGGDLGDLFRERANHTFLVKLSYWFAR